MSEGGSAGAASPSDPRRHIAHVEGRELPDEDVELPELERVPLPLRLLYLVLGLGLFVTALGLMKSGAQSLIPTLEGSIFTDTSLSTLGVGWLGACIVLSGSPVAASSLTLLDGGAITRDQAFTMLTGSRLGAAFVVVVVGVIYALRRPGSNRRAPVSIGILSLVMTSVTYVPGAIIGYTLLREGAFDDFDIGTSPSLTSATDTLFGWAADVLRDVLPGWTLFPIGLGVLLLGFQLIDKVMPSVGSERLEERADDAWYERKWPMFLVGCGVTLLTLSVAVSLTLLVPLVAKGYLRRANTLPYIAGANITTLADTLVAAILLGNQDGVRVVLAITASVSVWTVVLLAVAYPLLRRGALGATRRVLESRHRLGAFVAILFAVPLTLIAL
jgi:sodium-dependent phosphate cotransporter